MEVIVLDDSSDASSESEMATVSASTTPPTSPAPERRRAQSVGYADAVEAALAMAAALEKEETGASCSAKKKKRAPLAPPLLPTKTKNLQTTQYSSKKLLQAAKDRRNRQNTAFTHRDRERQRPASFSRSRARLLSSLSSNSSSDSNSSSSSGSIRRPRFGNSGAATGDRPQTSRRPKSKQPEEIVDHLSSSSSSSSESSLGRRSTLSSLSSLTQTPMKTGKKRLKLNDRVLGRSKSRPDVVSRQHSKSAEAIKRPQFSTHATKQSTNKTLLAVHADKRKRVLPQMRRESLSGTKKRSRVSGDQLTKEISKKKPEMNAVRPRDTVSKSSSATRKETVSLVSSSSSPASSPRAIPARKSVPSPSTALRSTSQADDGETDAFSRYHCRKSASVSTEMSSGKVRSVLPSSVSLVSTSALSSLSLPQSPPPSTRKKRRVFSYFDTDHVALDDLQAQERELAWIRSQRKQTQNRSQAPKPAAQKHKTCRQVIDVDADANSAAHVEEIEHNDAQQKQHNVKLKLGATTNQVSSLHSSKKMLHSTSYRGVFCDEAPPNILSFCGQTPFESECDHPLTFYDETETLASHCSVLESFGKPSQCLSSVFPSEMAKPQSDVTRLVSSLVTAHLPLIRRCHQRKVQAILTEAREKIFAYQEALTKHKRVECGQNVMSSHLLPRSRAEKHAVKQVKAVQHTCRHAASVSFQIGRGDVCVRERAVSSLIQINHVERIRPLRKYTTSIGLRTNYRVEDDPILRYTASARPTGTDGGNEGDEMAKKYGLRIGNVADEEVVEFVLRLVVGRLGDSEQVFRALKSELDFSQAYTAYSELKKLHDSRLRASARLDRVEKLRLDGEHASDRGVAAIVNLMEQSSLSKVSRSKALSKRLKPPIRYLESSIVDSLVDNATVDMASLGLRATDSYNELVDVYGGSFCRMCYRYNCHEHGGDHPLPARRVDPVYPRVRLMAHVAPPFNRKAALSDEDVACIDSEGRGRTRLGNVGASVRDDSDWKEAASSPSKVQHNSEESDVDMNESGSGTQQRRQKTMSDPSEYVNASHVSLVATKMRSFLSTGSACGKLCWKSGHPMDASVKRTTLSAAELGMLRKLRETMGDNSCLLAAIVGSVSCLQLHKLITKEQAHGDVTDGVWRSGRRVRKWKSGRRSGGSNHELLLRTRNQRLQDRGTENHEYQPCTHEGMCDSTGCSCMKRDHMCEKACACSRDCPNRFEGCSCSSEQCRTSKCSCFAALRECNPDVCMSCGASELAASVLAGTVATTSQRHLACGNVSVIRSEHKRLGMGFSSVHGYGMFAREAISANDFVYEYTGAMLSQDEAERRGLIYDKMEMSYLFDLNEDAVLDALRCGNKSKFINHEGETPNCMAKVVSVCGVHHITVWALRDIAVDEELVFDYGYKRSVGPDWSQRRAGSKDSI